MKLERKERVPLTLTDSYKDILLKMGEGNPGAITVLFKLMGPDGSGALKILMLDDMNIRGTQIWIGYKDYCHQDLDAFDTAIKNCDEKMIARINEEGMRGNHNNKAVRSGASGISAGNRMADEWFLPEK